jgi:hypothetical protein
VNFDHYEDALNGEDDWTEPEADEAGDIGDAAEFKQVLDELDDLGRRIGLAEVTARWMRFGEHAGQLRAACLDAGLGEALTARLVLAFIDTAVVSEEY